MIAVTFHFNRSRTRALEPVLASRIVEHISHDGWNFRLFFSRIVVFSKKIKISRFLPTADAQPARACTRYPAKHGSKGLTSGLDTAEHRLHCYVDHNSGGCSGYKRACTRRRTGTLQQSPQPLRYCLLS